eukprot:1489738-Lingulodinium_polyedra.AAC.1
MAPGVAGVASTAVRNSTSGPGAKRPRPRGVRVELAPADLDVERSEAERVLGDAPAVRLGDRLA